MTVMLPFHLSFQIYCDLRENESFDRRSLDTVLLLVLSTIAFNNDNNCNTREVSSSYLSVLLLKPLPFSCDENGKQILNKNREDYQKLKF